MVWNQTSSVKEQEKQSARVIAVLQDAVSRPSIEKTLSGRITATNKKADERTSDLVEEIDRRRRVEESLRAVNKALEQRLQKRTALAKELAQVNAKLESEISKRKQVEAALRYSEQELRASQDALNEKITALTRSNQDLEQFAYVASHDLQEPLRAITGYLQCLERYYGHDLGEDADFFINRSVAAAERMKRLIEDLLAYSRVGSQKHPFEPVDCAAILTRTVANLTAPIEESRAIISHDPLPSVLGDATQLAQLFQNLLSNAIKFRNGRTPRVHIGVERRSSSRENEWLFSVRDNGIGLDRAYAERVFLIFQRLHDRSEFSGTGVGLAICKKIVERHNGRIWVESEPGQGSTFFFTLPEKNYQAPVDIAANE